MDPLHDRKRKATEANLDAVEHDPLALTLALSPQPRPDTAQRLHYTQPEEIAAAPLVRARSFHTAEIVTTPPIRALGLHTAGIATALPIRAHGLHTARIATAPPTRATTRPYNQTPRGPQKHETSRSARKDEIIEPCYPWSTNRHAMVHTMDYLLSRGIKTIAGDMRCNKCQSQTKLQYDLEKKFAEVISFIDMKFQDMHDRAPTEWMTQSYEECRACGEPKCVRPVLPDKPDSYREINWLFLFLGQKLGWCTLEHLKYFCQHTSKHRTGAKDRVLYLTYMTICKQLNPSFS